MSSLNSNTRKLFFAILIVVAQHVAVAQTTAPSPIAADTLRCEYLHDPVGLDETAPRFSWELHSSRRGDRQTQYQLLVASSSENLSKDTGDLWDSGAVASAQSAQVVYAGKPLTSREICYWKVRAWDRDAKAGTWSNPARWEMGLVDPQDWSAHWVQPTPAGETAESFHILHASWESVDGTAAKDVTQMLTKKVVRGSLHMTANSRSLGGDVALKKDKQLRIDYDDVSGKQSEVFPEGERMTLPHPPISYLRKSFAIEKPVRQARLYATALGLYEIHLNGARAGDHVLAPDWTDYDKRVQYQAYDVTAQVKPGENAIGAMLANGWYAGEIGNGGFQHYGTEPALFAQLEITYTDGTVARIVTDDTWKMHPGPILASDFMQGEQYDARREIAGWDQPGLNDADWKSVSTREETGRHLVAEVNEPVRRTGELAAKTVAQAQPGHWVYDLGQNMVGVVRLKVQAPAGTRVTIRHAEMLSPDKGIYTVNLRSASSVDTYICRGGGIEIWQPHFTFHGFRYVELTGLSDPPPLDAITGIVLGSDTSRVGEFSCSDARINQLQSNIQWGQRGNYLSVPTDCPQRDERLGWMGDAEVFVRTATFNSDVAAFFSKWLCDVDDAQLPDGRFTDVSPDTSGRGGTPAWADAGVICPWTIYQAYGDTRVLQTHLPAMTKWVEWCRSHSNNLLRDKDRNSDYGDWLSIGANTPKDVIGTAYFAYSTHLLAKSYRAIGDTAKADEYEKLFADIRDAFNKAYVTDDCRIKGNTQCDYAMALKFELLPEGSRPLAAAHLEEDIKAKGDHLSTGFVGVSYLLPVLTTSGKLDTAYRLLMQDTFPSWLFSVKQGATTIWERWDGWTPDKGFQSPSMNSFNHYSLGSCGEWLFDSVAGIGQAADSAGFDHLVIRPRVGSALSTAHGSYHTIHGQVASDWKLADGTLALSMTIPINTTAQVFLPTDNVADVTESGKPLAEAEGVKFVRNEEGAAVLEIGSGSYAFKTPFKSSRH